MTEERKGTNVESVTKEVETDAIKNAAIKEDDSNEILRLDWAPRPFDSFGRSTRINSKDLAVMIRSQYQLSFYDCIGCIIECTNGTFNTTLFFQDKEGKPGDGQIKNLVNVANSQTAYRSNNLYYGMRNLNKRMAGKTYELTDETKILLSDVMYGGRHGKRKWNELVTERVLRSNQNYYANNASQIIVAVTGFNLNYLCRKLFGNRMVTETVREGDKIVNKTAEAKYECLLSNVLQDGSFMIHIDQFDPDKVDKLIRIENPNFIQQTGILMY